MWGDFLGEGEPASGQRPQGVLCGGGGRVKATWPEGCTARQQALSGEAVEGFSHHRRRVDADLLQRVHRRGARLHGGIPRDFELLDHLDGTIRGLWRRGRLARQHRSGGGLGVDPVGLAGDAAQAPVRSIHFHNTMPRSADRTRKAHAIAAGGIVKLRPQVAEYADDEPAAQLSRIPIPLRNHQSRRLALLPFRLEFPRCRRSPCRSGCGAGRGITVTYEAIRLWCRTFGLNYARRLRRRRGRQGDTWYLDELFVKIQGQQQYLWRAVDEDGDVLDILVQSRRNRRAATRFFRKLLKRQGREPRRLITDKLRSYSAAHRTVMPSVIHSTQQYENNRAEVSHQSTRQRERQMRRFRSAAHLQRFASVHGVVQNLFRVGRHLLRAAHHRLLRARSFRQWDEVTCAC